MPRLADERPAKKAKLLDDSDSDSDQAGFDLKVNEEYARRFEHNKKRAEKHRLEEKYGKSNIDQDDDEEDSEADVEEDDDGELATEALDAEIQATLNALRSKDPRIFDKDFTFYTPYDENAEEDKPKSKEKPMTLKDYHTKNLLEGNINGADDERPIRTYAQEQEDTRQKAIEAIQAQAGDDDDEDDFLVAKSKPVRAEKKVALTKEEVDNAAKDPDTFLSNFMAARAWVPTNGSQWQPLESDDDEDDERADEYENAYNMYFEDSAGANEKLVTYARDAVANTTVRRDEKKGRRKARDAAREKREAEKREREEEMARLRKLKIDEVEDKVKRIRQTAGMSGKDFKMEEWADVLDADWSDDEWDREMQKRFGESYYEEREGADSDEEGGKKRKVPKKPKFDDDIDINDLIPEFDAGKNDKPAFSLSDEDDAMEDADMEDEEPQHTTKSSKKRKQERADAKSASRRDRRLIENLVDTSLQQNAALAATSSKNPSTFRYRDTSPTTFGLTARDILLADDAQLNEFAGLKKLAAFRDPEKKKKDKKHLSKKARLRQWRTETFGNEDGPTGGFGDMPRDLGIDGDGAEGVDIKEGGKKKKRRSRKRKAGETEV